MATGLAAREVLVLATEDDCFSQFDSLNREGIYRSVLIVGKPDLACKASKTLEQL